MRIPRKEKKEIKKWMYAMHKVGHQTTVNCTRYGIVFAVYDRTTTKLHFVR